MVTPDLSLEKKYWQKGFINVAGVDEAGRGPLAGPVAAAAVIIRSENQVISFVRDSKKMTSSQREQAFEKICCLSTAYGIALVSAAEIDELGIQLAVKKAMMLALEAIEKNFNLKIQQVLVDGLRTQKLDRYSSERIKGGDLHHYSIAAASVLAKVSRDRHMQTLAVQYPQYGFERHVGYGTREHFEALKKYGLTPIHRKSFLKNYPFPSQNLII